MVPLPESQIYQFARYHKETTRKDSNPFEKLRVKNV